MSAKSKVDILEDLGVLGYLFIYFFLFSMNYFEKNLDTFSELGKSHIFVQK